MRAEPMSAEAAALIQSGSDRLRTLRRWRVAAIVVLVLATVGFAIYAERDRIAWPDMPAWSSWNPFKGSGTASTIRVQAGQSIATAIAGAAEGSEVIVEPGEYRERVLLKNGVRVVSRVPRLAIIRLPGDAAETDAAVVGAEISGASLSGFRILGDSATPLGTGVAVRNAEVMLVDVEIVGARAMAIEYSGASGGSVLGADIRDNPGVGIVVRNGAFPRISHNAFVRNATSERAAGTLLIEAGARPVVTGNTFSGVGPESVIVPAGVLPALERDNWFFNPPGAASSTPRPSGPGRATSTSSGRGSSTNPVRGRGR